MTRDINIAAAAYPLDRIEDFDAYRNKLTRWVEAAADCDLLIFPEHGGMELAALGGRDIATDPETALAEAARHASAREALHAELAAAHGVHILAASAPVPGDGRYLNRAVLFGPEGRIGHQDKQIVTRTEREDWRMDRTAGLRILDTALGRLGILIGEDCQFPLLARQLAEAGVEVILAPTCTDTLAGFNRMRIGAMARALESQCIVAHSVLVGPCDWLPSLTEGRGMAAIHAPPDGFWPDTGILAEGEMDRAGWVKVRVDLERIQPSRADGRALPFTHWSESGDSRIV